MARARDAPGSRRIVRTPLRCRHHALSEALEHLRELATELGPTVLYIHPLDSAPEPAGDA